MSNPSPENIHSSMLPPVDTKEDKPRKRSKFQKLIITRDFQQGRRNPGRVGRRGGNVKPLQGRRIVSECRCVCSFGILERFDYLAAFFGQVQTGKQNPYLKPRPILK